MPREEVRVHGAHVSAHFVNDSLATPRVVVVKDVKRALVQQYPQRLYTWTKTCCYPITPILVEDYKCCMLNSTCSSLPGAKAWRYSLPSLRAGGGIRKQSTNLCPRFVGYPDLPSNVMSLIVTRLAASASKSNSNDLRHCKCVCMGLHRLTDIQISLTISALILAILALFGCRRYPDTAQAVCHSRMLSQSTVGPKRRWKRIPGRGALRTACTRCHGAHGRAQPVRVVDNVAHVELLTHACATLHGLNATQQ